jgi:hypothetical protein
MKTLLLATIVGIAAVAASTTPASAHLVAVATSVDATNIEAAADLEKAVEGAVADVLQRAIAFTPTFVTLQNSRVVGRRIYIMLLIGDRDGEETLKTLRALDEAGS